MNATDVYLDDQRTISVLHPASAAADPWLVDHLPDATMFGRGGVVIEHRFVCGAIAGDGLTIADGIVVRGPFTRSQPRRPSRVGSPKAPPGSECSKTTTSGTSISAAAAPSRTTPRSSTSCVRITIESGSSGGTSLSRSVRPRGSDRDAQR
jgi:hypothetical protein